jgi:hypothetical protein
VPIRLSAVLAALVLALVACGDADEASTAAPAAADVTVVERTTVRSVALRADALETTRFEGTITVDGARVALVGSVDPAAEAAAVTIDWSELIGEAIGAGDALPPELAPAFEEPLELIAIGDETWVSWPLLGVLLGVDTPWLAVTPEDARDLTSDFGLGEPSSPTAFLEQFADADAEVTDLGRETVRGVTTTHYRISVDVEQLTSGLTPEEAATLRDNLGPLEGERLPIDVWVADDGRLHRYHVDLRSAGPGADGRSARLEFEFFDHGTDVAIAPPPPDQTTTLDDLGPGAGLGG